MKITFDNIIYSVEDSYIKDQIEKRVDKVLDTKIKLPHGPTIDLSSRGILSTMIRQAFVLLLPTLQWCANSLQIELPLKQKHGDIIRYTIECYLIIAQKLASETNLVVYSDIVSGENKITGIKVAQIVESVKQLNTSEISDEINGQNSFS